MKKNHIRRRFVKINKNFFHYLECGAGFPVVLFHESPKSSFSNETLILSLAKKYKVYAIDTPGYGFSDPIDKKSYEISDFAKAINKIICCLGLGKFILYGNHTGASIAIEYGRLFPKELNGLILESLPVFYPHEVKSIIKYFFPPIKVTKDGSHLTSLWSKVEDQYLWFPWYDREYKKMHHWPYPSAIEIHDYVIDFLRAGDSYRRAYLSAFKYNSFETIKKLRVPTKFLSIETDILYSHRLRFPKLKKNQYLTIINNSKDKINTIKNCVNFFKTNPTSTEKQRVPNEKNFLDIEDGQVYYKILKKNNNKPVLFLIHDLPGSSEDFRELMLELSKTRTVISFDIPGTGNSFINLPNNFTLNYFVEIFDNLIVELGIESYDIYSKGLGGYLSSLLSKKAKLKPRKIIFDRFKVLTKKEKEKLVLLNKESLKINYDGSHLLKIWRLINSSIYFFPWYNKKGMILSHTKKHFNELKLNNKFMSIFNNLKLYPLVFKKVLSHEPESDINIISNYILFIKESKKKKNSVDKNIKINNNKTNFIILQFVHEKKLTSSIIKFLDTIKFN